MKHASVPAGTYIIAVSGGVDSMVLFDILRRQRRVVLIVVHFDHAMRENSQQDRKLVERVALSHNIRFVYEAAARGSLKGEAAARNARYDFLRRMCKKYNACAIITAHHQDDLLETAVINLLRGTGRRGLSALRSTSTLMRPLLNTPKAEMVDYAIRHQLEWSEDQTNNNQMYLRNYVRHSLLPRFKPKQRKQLLKIIVRQNQLNDEITHTLQDWYAAYAQHMSHAWSLPRYQLVMLPDHAAYEWLQFIIERQTGKTLEAPLAWRALHFIKTARHHKRFLLNGQWQLVMQPRGKIIVESRAA